MNESGLLAIHCNASTCECLTKRIFFTSSQLVKDLSLPGTPTGTERVDKKELSECLVHEKTWERKRERGDMRLGTSPTIYYSKLKSAVKIILKSSFYFHRTGDKAQQNTRQPGV
jgi:hypothetical protein